VSGKESFHEFCQVLLKILQNNSLSVKSFLKGITVNFNVFLSTEYLYWLLCFVVENMENLEINIQVQRKSTRHEHDFHVADANLIFYLKGVLKAGTKLYNALPSNT
jgi:hypothetical protein